MTARPSPDDADRSTENPAVVEPGATPTPRQIDRWVQELVLLTHTGHPDTPSDGPGTADPGPPAPKHAPTAEPDDSVMVARLLTESVPSALDLGAYQRALADELGRLRRRRGWTRKQLLSRMAADLSVQTLATYEQGTRHVSVLRLVELCYAMNELPHHLIARVHQRLTQEGVVANVPQMAELAEAPLTPLRMWARQQLRQHPGAQDFRFDLVALRRMAELCDLPLSDLVRRLNELPSKKST
ncbi:hypothetical protein [Amycolatopsis sp. lyj-23]|uniref:hypothetical protein n=1 Tax=Amycolatopsis sp. lyj-23 TaxID=2789283 RepID=UPI003979DB7F